MAYATTEQIKSAAGGNKPFVELFDWDRDGVADAAEVADCLRVASGFMDGYFARRFAVPIANPTDTLSGFAAWLTVYECRDRKHMLTDKDEQRHAKALVWLEAVARGLIKPSNPEPELGEAVGAVFVEDESDVSRENLKGFC